MVVIAANAPSTHVHRPPSPSPSRFGGEFGRHSHARFGRSPSTETGFFLPFARSLDKLQRVPCSIFYSRNSPAVYFRECLRHAKLNFALARNLTKKIGLCIPVNSKSGCTALMVELESGFTTTLVARYVV